MEITFNNLVDEVQKLNKEQKEELKILLDKYLIEEQRKEIHQNYLSAKNEIKEGKVKFSSNIDKLKKHLEND